MESSRFNRGAKQLRRAKHRRFGPTTAGVHAEFELAHSADRWPKRFAAAGSAKGSRNGRLESVARSQSRCAGKTDGCRKGAKLRKATCGRPRSSAIARQTPLSKSARRLGGVCDRGCHSTREIRRLAAQIPYGSEGQLYRLLSVLKSQQRSQNLESCESTRHRSAKFSFDRGSREWELWSHDADRLPCAREARGRGLYS